MGNLLTSLLNTAGALRVYSQALNVTQENVTNASTPGYAKQTQSLEAMRFDLTVGLPGGVMAGPVLSSRNAFAEQSVRDQQTSLGMFQQKAADLTPLQTAFSLSNTSGIAPAMSALFSSFSQLSVSPNDTVSRQNVIDQAKTLAQTFQQTAAGLSSQGANLDQNTRGTIDEINRLGGIVAEINSQNRVDATGGIDAGVDAQLNTTLEQLSQLTNFTALQQTDGSITVYIGGQTLLVAGDQLHAIQGDFSTAQTGVLNSNGADITGQLTGGQLSALLDDKNVALPSYMADLNTLAQNFADQVNTALQNGIDQSGAAPAVDLFHYDAFTGAAMTLGVNPITPDQIAAALPGSPGGNGNALALANLANSKNLNGYTFAQYYGNLSGRVGRDLATAKEGQTTKENLLSQAQTLRQQTSAVSLDEEAEHLISFQRAYQAVSKMLGVLNGLTDTLMNIIK